MPLPRLSAVDACPGALRLHQAADGPLARVRLPGGMLSGAQLAVLAVLADRWGDAHVEVTSRANAQLRAVTGVGPTELAEALSAAGLFPSASHETVRNIAAPPLAGPAIRTLVTDLDRALIAEPALAALPGRFLFALGDVPLTADVTAVPASPAPRPGDVAAVRPSPAARAGDESFAILFDGADEGLRVRPAEVVPAMIAAAHAFLAERADAAPAPEGEPAATPAWRLRELPDGPARVARRTAAALGRHLSPAAEEPTVEGRNQPEDEPLQARGRGGDQPLRARRRADQDLVGVVEQGDGMVAVAALIPLGRLTPGQLAALTRADRLVITPWRGVVVPDLTPGAAQGWLRDLAAAGLAVEPDSPWVGVTACAGRPGCHRALADVRAGATAAATFVDGLPVHWIGCARGCGSPNSPHVRVEATPDGYTVTVVRPGSGPVAAPHPTPTQAEPPLLPGDDRGPAERVAAARRQ